MQFAISALGKQLGSHIGGQYNIAASGMSITLGQHDLAFIGQEEILFEFGRIRVRGNSADVLGEEHAYGGIRGDDHFQRQAGGIALGETIEIMLRERSWNLRKTEILDRWMIA